MQGESPGGRVGLFGSPSRVHHHRSVLARGSTSVIRTTRFSVATDVTSPPPPHDKGPTFPFLFVFASPSSSEFCSLFSYRCNMEHVWRMRELQLVWAAMTRPDENVISSLTNVLLQQKEKKTKRCSLEVLALFCNASHPGSHTHTHKKTHHHSVVVYIIPTARNVAVHGAVQQPADSVSHGLACGQGRDGSAASHPREGSEARPERGNGANAVSQTGTRLVCRKKKQTPEAKAARNTIRFPAAYLYHLVTGALVDKT